MCIISGPVFSVNSTKIFVAPSLPSIGNRQLTVYGNEVATQEQNLMILPVPHPQTVHFEPDVMKYKGLFRDAKDSFHIQYYETLSMTSLRSGGEQTLKVFNVGSYKASIANSVDDLMRLDPDVFNLPRPELVAMLRGTYGPDFGFVCCILKKGGNKYQPIAYSHERAQANTLFVPTKHYHVDDRTDEYMTEGMRRFNSNRVSSKWADDWDHEIYSLGTTADSAHKQSAEPYIPKDHNELNWNRFPAEFRWTAAQRLHAWRCSGEFANVDLEFTLQPI